MYVGEAQPGGVARAFEELDPGALGEPNPGPPGGIHFDRAARDRGLPAERFYRARAPLDRKRVFKVICLPKGKKGMRGYRVNLLFRVPSSVHILLPHLTQITCLILPLISLWIPTSAFRAVRVARTSKSFASTRRQGGKRPTKRVATLKSLTSKNRAK